MTMKKCTILCNVVLGAAIVWIAACGVGSWYQLYLNWWMTRVPGWFKTFGFWYTPVAIKTEMTITLWIVIFALGLFNGWYIGWYRAKHGQQ